MKGRGGIIVGEKGVQYGLIKPGAKQTGKPVAAPRPSNVFGDESDEEDVGSQVAREAAKKRSNVKVAEMHAMAVAEDPTVFDYDGVYDSMQQQKVAPKVQQAVERKPRYIAAILEQTERRKREQDIVYERILKKEQEQDKELYEDKEKFVTSAYRKKLEENQQWIEQEKLREEEEKKHDPKALGNMNSFYQNLLTKNVAFGGGKAAPAQPEAEQPVAAEPEVGTAAASGPPQLSSKAAQKLEQLDKYERLRLEAELARRGKLPPGAAAAGQPDAEYSGHREASPGEEDMKAEPATSAAAQPEPAVEASAPAAAAPAPAPGASAQRRHDDAAIAAARERYLARKRKLPDT